MNVKSALHCSEELRRLSDEGCLKRMDLTYNITLFRLNQQISEIPCCLLELQDDVKSTLQCSQDIRRLSEKNGSQIHDNTFQTELSDF